MNPFENLKVRLNFGREDANLIIASLRKTFSQNTMEYLCYRRHYANINLYRPELMDAEIPILKPIPIPTLECCNFPLVKFILEFFPCDLKTELYTLFYDNFLVLDWFTNSLLKHECDYYRVTCKKHLRLIMKLNMALRTSTCLDWICKDLRHFHDFDLGANLMAAYFTHFVVEPKLMDFFMEQRYLPTTILLKDHIFRNDHLIPYFISIFESYTHLCVARKDFHLLRLLIQYGAKNLDEHENPAYETYTKKNFFDRYYFRTEREPGNDPNFLINSRIEMRVLQVFIWNRYGEKNAIQMLQLSHLEPYITKQEYERTFDGFVTHLDGPNQVPNQRQIIKENLKRESWKCYKKILEIEDDAPVTPRSLQDVCRYVIRDKMSRNGNLLHNVEDLFDDCVNPWEDYLTLENVLVKGSKFHLIEFLEWVRRHERNLRHQRNRRNQRR